MIYHLFVFLFMTFCTSAQALSPQLYVATDAEFRAELERHSLSTSAWIDSLQEHGFDLLCLGETHSNEYRELWANLVLRKLAPKRLAIEATQEEVNVILEKHRENGNAKLLDAEFSLVLGALPKDVVLDGVEATQKEKLLEQNERINGKEIRHSRDGFIASHLQQLMKKEPVVALYGSLHCGEWSAGLGFLVPFFRLLKSALPDKKLISAFLVPEREVSNPLRAFADGYGLLKSDIVIRDGRKINPKLYNYRTDIRNLFETYDVIVLPRRTRPIDDNER